MSASGKEGNEGARRRLFGNVAALYLLQGLNYLIPMATLPYLVRVLGIQTYGLIAFTQAFAQYFVTFTDYGFNFSATRYIAQNKQERSLVVRMFWCVMVVKILLMVSGMVILTAILVFVPRFHAETAYFSVAYLAVVGSVVFPQWYFQGMEQMKHISVLTGAARLVTSGLLFVFVHSPSDALTAVGLLSAGPLLAGILGFGVAYLDLRPEFYLPSRHELWETANDGWHLFISTAAISLYTNTNVFLVGLLAGNTEAGYFSAAEKLIRALTGLIGPITQAFFPHISALIAEGKAVAVVFIRKTLRLTGAVSFLGSLVLMTFANPLAHLLFGKNAAGSVPIIHWIAFLPFLITVSNALGIQTMLSFGLDKLFSRILVASGILNVVLAFPLIHFFAAKGAAISVLIVEAAVTVAMIVVLEGEGVHLFRGTKSA
ncbi:flippase [Terriglobus sp. ADX1]|uniref:flippase n=1 Tax=Terriglobus sp. ADX1 TaxID=2794063 RepID=UPI002FE6BBF6